MDKPIDSPDTLDEILTGLHHYNLGHDPITDEPFTAKETYAIYPDLMKAKVLLQQYIEGKIREAQGQVISDIYNKAHEFANADDTMIGSESLRNYHWFNAINVVQAQLKGGDK